MVFSPDSKYIATGSNDKSAIIWDLSSGAIIKIFDGHSDSV